MSINDKQIENFLIENKQQLIQIYVNERNREGEGLLMITKTSTSNVNVGFMKFNDLSKELKDQYIEKVEFYKNKQSIIFFYICVSESEAYWLDVDLQS
jgi:uncharacterized radical SAM superfamily protein